jgi:hypothetical protein
LHKKWVDKQNTRYGLRGLAKHPGFTATVVITLAPAIDASSAIFSVVDSVLLPPAVPQRPESSRFQ